MTRHSSKRLLDWRQHDRRLFLDLHRRRRSCGGNDELARVVIELLVIIGLLLLIINICERRAQKPPPSVQYNIAILIEREKEPRRMIDG
jgi:hypothetical protein